MRRDIFLKLLPLLILYFAVFFVFASNSIDYGDEWRYASYAENLTRGFYAPPDTRFLWNGPGYPLLLVPFAFWDIPWIYAKMLNPVFMFLAVCFIYASIRNYVPEKPAMFFSYLFGLYPPFFADFSRLLTEPFVLMLVTLFALLTVRWFESGKYRFMFFAAVACALIALTKVFFAYVASAVLLLSLVLSVWSRTARKTVPVYALGLLLCVPYLAYTYSLTGRIFCWANSGGTVLYWLYNPYPDEFGDWKSEQDVATRPELARHRPFFEQLEGLDFVQRDQLLKKKALENIVNNPGKMLFNYVSNWGRLFLNFPYSYKYQHPRQLLYLLPNSLLLAAMVFCIYPLVKLRRYLPAAIIHACGVSVVYLGGHSLVYAQARFLCPIIPFIFIVIAYTAANLIKLQASEQHFGPELTAEGEKLY